MRLLPESAAIFNAVRQGIRSEFRIYAVLCSAQTRAA